MFLAAANGHKATNDALTAFMSMHGTCCGGLWFEQAYCDVWYGGFGGTIFARFEFGL